MVLPTYDSKLRQDLDHWAKLNKIELNIIIESQDISVKKLMATSELGLIPTAIEFKVENLTMNDASLPPVIDRGLMGIPPVPESTSPAESPDAASLAGRHRRVAR